jgi:glucan 1,3-beta-glucosidase
MNELTTKLPTTKAWAAHPYSHVYESLKNKNIHVIMQNDFLGPTQWIGTMTSTINDLNPFPSYHRSDFAVDTHLYQDFKPEERAMTRSSDFLPARHAHVPVYVGEWSSATRICVSPDGSPCETEGASAIRRHRSRSGAGATVC